VDPFGLGALNLATRYWTPADRNVRLPELTGLLLGNRVLWIAVGAALLAAAFALFKPDREGLRLFRRRRRAGAEAPPEAASAPIVLPMVSLREGFASRCRQFVKLAWFDTRHVLRSVPFLVMLAFGLVNLGAILGFSG